MTDTPFPPAPWRLRGEAVVVAAPVRAQTAGTAPRRMPGGRLLGGVVLARYGSGSTLTYHEIVVFSGLARAGARAGLQVSWIAVDSAASVAGGRAIWALPKRLAEFTWTSRTVTVAEGDAPVLRAHVRRRGRRVVVPVVAPFFGQADGRVEHTIPRGRLTGAPALVELEVPAGSPLGGLGLEGRRAGFVATALDLVVPAPGSPQAESTGTSS